MSPHPFFSRIDTVLVRVSDLAESLRWYGDALELPCVYRDDVQRLAVLEVGGPTFLTLWQWTEGEKVPAAGAPPISFIFKVEDAVKAREALAARGVKVGPLQEGGGVRSLHFHDPDGNRLEACETTG